MVQNCGIVGIGWLSIFRKPPWARIDELMSRDTRECCLDAWIATGTSCDDYLCKHRPKSGHRGILDRGLLRLRGGRRLRRHVAQRRLVALARLCTISPGRAPDSRAASGFIVQPLGGRRRVGARTPRHSPFISARRCTRRALRGVVDPGSRPVPPVAQRKRSSIAGTQGAGSIPAGGHRPPTTNEKYIIDARSSGRRGAPRVTCVGSAIAGLRRAHVAIVRQAARRLISPTFLSRGDFQTLALSASPLSPALLTRQSATSIDEDAIHSRERTLPGVSRSSPGLCGRYRSLADALDRLHSGPGSASSRTGPLRALWRQPAPTFRAIGKKEADMRSVIISIVALSLVAIWTGCSSTPDRTSTNHFDGQSAAAHTPTVQAQTIPHSKMPIVFATTFPKALCHVHPAGQTSPSGQALADDSGIAHFFAPPPEWGTNLSLDCSDQEGTTGTYLVDLNDSSAFNKPTTATTHAVARTKAALTGDLSRYSRDEVIAMGYPPPPKTGTHKYELWRKLVTTPTTFATPIADLTAHHNSTEYPPSWGGLELAKSGVTYAAAEAEFYVPSVYNNGITSESSIWVGLGGDGNYPLSNGTYNLIQAGVEIDNPADYYAWAEYAEGPLYMCSTCGWFAYGTNCAYGDTGTCTPYTVAANDFISPIWCWPSDANGTWDVSGTYGTCSMDDQTQGWNSQMPAIPAPNGNFNGRTAEFIIEAKPTCAYGPQNYCLSEYGAAVMDGFADDVSDTGHDFCTDGFNYIVTTETNGHGLQGAQPASGSCETTDWQWDESY